MVNYVIFFILVSLIFSVFIVLLVFLIWWLKIRKIKRNIPSEQEVEQEITNQDYVKNQHGRFERRKKDTNNGRKETIGEVDTENNRFGGEDDELRTQDNNTFSNIKQNLASEQVDRYRREDDGVDQELDRDIREPEEPVRKRKVTKTSKSRFRITGE